MNDPYMKMKPEDSTAKIDGTDTDSISKTSEAEKTRNAIAAEEKEKAEREDAKRNKKNLDEGLEESMDASDPPSTTQP